MVLAHVEVAIGEGEGVDFAFRAAGVMVVAGVVGGCQQDEGFVARKREGAVAVVVAVVGEGEGGCAVAVVGAEGPVVVAVEEGGSVVAVVEAGGRRGVEATARTLHFAGGQARAEQDPQGHWRWNVQGRRWRRRRAAVQVTGRCRRWRWRTAAGGP